MMKGNFCMKKGKICKITLLHKDTFLQRNFALGVTFARRLKKNYLENKQKF